MFPFRTYNSGSRVKDSNGVTMEGEDVRAAVETVFPNKMPPLTGESLLRYLRNVDIYVSFIFFPNYYYYEINYFPNAFFFFFSQDIGWYAKMGMVKTSRWCYYLEILQKIQRRRTHPSQTKIRLPI